MIPKAIFATLIKFTALFSLILTVFTNSAFAQQWAADMFETKNHDFGTVARGAKAEYEFVFTNIYMEDVHVASVRTSCGCTKATIKTPGNIKTYEQGAIVAAINTSSFLGNKGATITVTFDKPQYAEVQLHVRSYIRSDVVFNPGSVSFGTVEAGTPMERSVTIDYVGHNGWQIQDVRSDNPHIAAAFSEIGRGGSHVSYRLDVRLDKDAPVGYINEHLMLITNDQGSQQVPLEVDGRVNSGITVSPNTLFMGVVKPGSEIEKKLVVRGKQPFRIVSIKCPGGDFKFDKKALTETKTVHVVPITFIAGADPGKIARKIQIETDQGSASKELSAYAVVERN